MLDSKKPCKAANQNKNRLNTKSSVDKNNIHCNKNVLSGTYLNKIVAELMNDDDDDIHKNNNADLKVNQTILRASINNCISRILLDS